MTANIVVWEWDNATLRGKKGDKREKRGIIRGKKGETYKFKKKAYYMYILSLWIVFYLFSFFLNY